MSEGLGYVARDGGEWVGGEEERPCSLYAKMVRVMGRMERLPRRGYNAYFNYDFVTDADVLDAVRCAMAEEGLALFSTMVDVRQSEGKTVVWFEFTFVDDESGETRSVSWVGESLDKQDKGVAKAATAALKSVLLKTFLISTGDEVELDVERLEEKKPVPKEGKAKHWIASEGVRKKFWAWTSQDLGLSDDEVHEALGVESVYEWPGTKREAMEKILAWVAGQIAAQGEARSAKKDIEDLFGPQEEA
uniref:Putative Erf family protein n=1 Tax=viral metagenome TaxID=1070528 RepID=A0A6H1ZYJ8_9ZZZZ